jgi:hypothetical protein
VPLEHCYPVFRFPVVEEIFQRYQKEKCAAERGDSYVSLFDVMAILIGIKEGELRGNERGEARGGGNDNNGEHEARPKNGDGDAPDQKSPLPYVAHARGINDLIAAADVTVSNEGLLGESVRELTNSLSERGFVARFSGSQERRG